jgi:hypothetical protein
MPGATLLLLTFLASAGDAPTPEEKALAFLEREVPRWAEKNKCYSCHNNGDAAGALYRAVKLGRKVRPEALADTTRWLSRPGEWDNNGGDGAFNDRKLAALQFSAALVEAIDSGLLKNPEALSRAAERVANQQDEDGGWTTDAEGAIGSPATHGRALATYFARRNLVLADEKKYARVIGRADRWARNLAIKTVPDAAGVLLALGRADDDLAVKQRQAALAYLVKAEGRDGGWGPDARSPNEVFDTAIAVLALTAPPDDDTLRTMRRRGRAYLVKTQQEDGSWPETTRPSGATSYAQRLATAGWATLALLATP